MPTKTVPVRVDDQNADLLAIDSAIAAAWPHLEHDCVLYGDASGWDLSPVRVFRIVGKAKRDKRFPDVPAIGSLPTKFANGSPLHCEFIRVLFVGWDDVNDPHPFILAASLGSDHHLHYYLSAWTAPERSWSGWVDLGKDTPESRFAICYGRLTLRAEGNRSNRSRVNLVAL